MSPYALIDKRITDEDRAEYAAADKELRAAARACTGIDRDGVCLACGTRLLG